MEIGFNSRYLLDVADEIEGEGLELRLPMRWRRPWCATWPMRTALYVLMPMRV